MNGHESRGGKSRRVARVVFPAAGMIVLLTAVVIGTGVGLAAVLGRGGSDKIWSRLSDVGQAFGVVNSVVSALAVVALVVTWMMQSRDLAVQRRILEDAQVALRRSADVGLRDLHTKLISMAIDHPDLAAVWPNLGVTDPVLQLQYMYANLLLQHAWLQHTTGVATREDLISNVRFLFASPKVRAFWRDTANSRESIYVEGSRETRFADLADEIWHEYEAVLACSTSDDRSSNERCRERTPGDRTV